MAINAKATICVETVFIEGGCGVGLASSIVVLNRESRNIYFYAMGVKEEEVE